MYHVSFSHKNRPKKLLSVETVQLSGKKLDFGVGYIWVINPHHLLLCGHMHTMKLQ